MTEETTTGDVESSGEYVIVGQKHLWSRRDDEPGGLVYVGPLPSNIFDPMPAHAASNAALDEAARDAIEAPMPDATQAKGLGPEFAARISRFHCAVARMAETEMEIDTLRERMEKFGHEYNDALEGIRDYVRNWPESEPSR